MNDSTPNPELQPLPPMSKARILRDDQSYTFCSYFELAYESDDILAEFGYRLIRSALVLPQTTQALDDLRSLR